MPFPALTVTTRRVADPGRLVPMLSAESPLLWMRRGYGMAGVGEALRLEFRGPTRIADAASAWQRIVAAATVDDPIAEQGTGLVAFASFAFSDASPTSSVLIVPSVLVGRTAEGAWLTTVSTDAAMPPAVPFGGSATVAFSAGALDAEGYREAVSAAVSRIRGHELSKVVLARDLVGTLPPGADLRRAIDTLGMGYPDCWTFSVDGFLGSSPETLVGVRRGTVTARVLAGSAARGIDAASDLDAAAALATSAKDQDEHRFAVQNVLASLRAHSPNLAASEMPFTLKLPNLWHLASDVEGDLVDGSTSLDLVGTLHPTAAVAGTPTSAALAVIDELEGFDRGRYAGPVGWVGADGDGEWAVALRSAQVDATGTVTAWAGAGIVAESDPERELLETRLKFRPIVESFA